MAREAGLAVEILDEKRLAELKMGALLGVASGSAEPPRMIVMTYTPPSPKPGAPVLALVGKAVTFDTGGISIKPSADMEKMKFDMAGGAAMLGVMRVLAQLKPAIKVICRDSVGREYARRPRAKAGRRADCHVREVRRSDQHRRRGAAHSCGCAALRASSLAQRTSWMRRR